MNPSNYRGVKAQIYCSKKWFVVFRKYGFVVCAYNFMETFDFYKNITTKIETNGFNFI